MSPLSTHMADSDRIRIQVTLSQKLREYLESQAELRGQGIATVAASILADRMIDDWGGVAAIHPPKQDKAN